MVGEKRTSLVRMEEEEAADRHFIGLDFSTQQVGRMLDRIAFSDIMLNCLDKSSGGELRAQSDCRDSRPF